MDKFPMMVYSAPGPERLQGLTVGLSTGVATSEEDLAAAKRQGWHETTTEAVAAYEAQQADEADKRIKAANAEAKKAEAKKGDKAA